jgi:hypothetical protein
MNYETLSDEELTELLVTEEDRLPRAAVDEFIARGERMVPYLAEIISQSYSWTKRLPEWWAVVHATFILGAIGSKEAVLPLLKAVRYASEHDCDWVTTTLPSIFGRIGPDAADGLQMIALDRTSDWYVRATAIEGLAAVTLSHSDVSDEIFRFIGSIFTDEQEERNIRDAAGNVLLDFKREEYKDALTAYGREADDMMGGNLFYPVAFAESDVIRALGPGEKTLWHYMRNWLQFYDENYINDRQKRWKKEDKERRQRGIKERGKLLHSGSPSIHKEAKTGRNEPCPCGSGKKFKKCCGR